MTDAAGTLVQGTSPREPAPMMIALLPMAAVPPRSGRRAARRATRRRAPVARAAGFEQNERAAPPARCAVRGSDAARVGGPVTT